MTLGRLFLSVVTATALFGGSLLASGCYEDECAGGCQTGYACYYGVCLSRGWCPADDDHADTCAQYNDLGECTQRVDHGICDRGYVCVCRTINDDGECEPSSRECMPSTDAEE